MSTEPKTLPLDPDNQNSNRSDLAHAAVRAFQVETGTDDCDAIADLIGDLAHFCDRNPEYGTVWDAIRRAKSYYREETDSTGRQFDEE